MKSVVIFWVWCLTNIKGLEEGDDCNLHTGKNGKCINIHRCDYAKGLLQNNQNPGICGFQKNDPLVCCTNVDSRVSTEYGELAAAKCKEYYPYKKYFLLVPGAKPSLAKEFPHMAVIGFGERDDIQWSCGGSLISKTFVLTAAHCLSSIEFGDARYVRLGDLDLAIDTDEAQLQDFSVKRLIPHPDYKRPARYHDIALIELDRPVKLTEFVTIACLDTRRIHNETKMTVTGWGRTQFLGPTSSHLLKADFDIVPQNICRSKYETVSPSILPFGIVDDSQICAGGTKKLDTCEGDSGSPLQIINKERSSSIRVFDIVGVTSFGRACGLSLTPGVYTRVYNYLPWIESIVWPS